LLENLLDWAQIQRGKIRSIPENTSVHELTTEVLTILSTRASEKKHKLINETETALRIHSDPKLLKVVLINLVNNAIKFTPENGLIMVRSHMEGGFIRIEVSDNGIGIPASEVKKLFVIDAQYQRPGTMDEPGTGLGLVMCREFVNILGGEIGINSEVEKGSVFYFTIPFVAAKEEKTPEKEMPSEIKTDEKARRLNILIAEDDAASSILLTRMVKGISNSILHVTNGREAVDTCRNNPDIDLVLMDLSMPELNGIDAILQIRGFNSKVIIIAQTAHVVSGEREKAKTAGCNDFIEKPLKDNELMRTIQTYFTL